MAIETAVQPTPSPIASPNGESAPVLVPGMRMTPEEFQRLPEGPPYYELEEGELILMSSPVPEHQEITALLFVDLRRFVRQGKLGRVFMEVDVFLPDGRGYIPDISFVSAARSDLHSHADRKIHGAPDLVVEVTSGVPARDRVTKFRAYYDNGVPWYWIIDGETLSIEEYHATPDGYQSTVSVDAGEEFQPGVFPGLVVNLVELVEEAT